jgi:hypothetical protein
MNSFEGQWENAAIVMPDPNGGDHTTAGASRLGSGARPENFIRYWMFTLPSRLRYRGFRPRPESRYVSKWKKGPAKIIPDKIPRRIRFQ